MSSTPDIARKFTYHGPALDTITDTYKELLDKCPVGRSEQLGGFVFLTRSEDILAAEQDPETFSVTPSMLLPSFGNETPMIPIDVDPPDHGEYRRILLPLFTPKKIAQLTDGMRATAKQLADQVASQDVADVSALFARPMPTIIFSRLAGFPESDWPKFDRWVDEVIYERVLDPDRSTAASREVEQYFDALLESRINNPIDADDLIKYLLGAEVNGRPLSRPELVSYCYLLFLAGLDTTAWAIRASLWHLAQHPEDQKRLREDPELLPAAVEEWLRTMSPVQAMARTCMRDTELSGQQIKSGERVVLVFGAGNRDPETFDDPDEIILDRENNRHLSFGGGIHRCLGSNLARQELIVGLEEFLNAVPQFSLADENQPWHGVGPLELEIGG
ncbi:cytochrome P450 [Prescottella defluvii]|nr:cytochrome P450 [Prescottella defluvii]